LSEIESGDTTYITVDSFGLDTLVTAFFTAKQSSDFNAIQAYLNIAKLLSDTPTHISSPSSSSTLSNAWSALSNIPTTAAQDVNFVTVMTIYLNYHQHQRYRYDGFGIARHPQQHRFAVSFCLFALFSY
jgi:hypothetical protein